MVGVLEEYESEAHDGGSSDVIVDVRDRDVEQLTDSLVVASPAVRHSDGVHTRPKHEHCTLYIPDLNIYTVHTRH